MSLPAHCGCVLCLRTVVCNQRAPKTFRSRPRGPSSDLQQKMWKTLWKNVLSGAWKPHQVGHSSDLHHPGAAMLTGLR